MYVCMLYVCVCVYVCMYVYCSPRPLMQLARHWAATSALCMCEQIIYTITHINVWAEPLLTYIYRSWKASHLYVPTTYMYQRYTWLHTHTHTNMCMHTCIHAYMITHTHTNMCMHTCIHAYMHTCIHAYMHTCVHAYMHAYIHVYMQPTTTEAALEALSCNFCIIHTYKKPILNHIYIYTHMFMHTCAYIHAYMHTCSRRQLKQLWRHWAATSVLYV